MEPLVGVNSEPYWNSRFDLDWESKAGPKQSRFFAKIAIEHLPQWLMTEIRSKSLTLVDWGCAQGDGTDEWAAYLSPRQLTGVDFSTVAIEKALLRYPAIRFVVENWLSETTVCQGGYDFVFTSNVLEHFHEPYEVLKTLSEKAQKGVLLALPYREINRHEEHFFAFLPENLPLVLPNGFRLIWTQVVNCSTIPGTLWLGDQIILAYVNTTWLDSLGLTLRGCLIQHEDVVYQIDLLKASLMERNERITALVQANADRERELQGTLLALGDELRRAEQAWLAKSDEQGAFYIAERDSSQAELRELRRLLLVAEREKEELVHGDAERKRELQAMLETERNKLLQAEKEWQDRSRNLDLLSQAERNALQMKLEEAERKLQKAEQDRNLQAQSHLEKERMLNDSLRNAEKEMQACKIAREREFEEMLETERNKQLHSEQEWLNKSSKLELLYQVERNELKIKLDEVGRKLQKAVQDKNSQAQSHLERERTLSERIQNTEMEMESWKTAAYETQAKIDAIMNSKVWRLIASLRTLLWRRAGGRALMQESTIREKTSFGFKEAFSHTDRSGGHEPFATTYNENPANMELPSNSMENSELKVVKDLIELQGKSFIRQAYQVLLGRLPDPEGLAYYLSRLNQGDHKLAILDQLRRSSEAKKYNANLPVLNKLIRRHKWGQMPFAGWLKPPRERVENKLRAIEVHLQELDATKISELEDQIEKKNAYIEEKEIYIAQLLQNKATPAVPTPTLCKFNPYELIEQLKPIDIKVISNNYSLKSIRQRFSCVVTVRNEAMGIHAFLNSIAKQELKPVEIIIVDGGSTDETIDIIERFASNAGLPIKLLKAGPTNIAEGRNLGISKSQHEIVLLADAGCELTSGHFANLIGPFEEFSNIDLVSGIYRPLEQSEESSNFISDWSDNTDWHNFLPSARSLAIRKSIWAKARKFPEYLTRTGEDTFFDVQYRRHSKSWLINKQACVLWDAPTTREASASLAYSYGYGDGESGYGDFRFHQDWINNCHGVYPDNLTQHQLGYLDGRRHRPIIEVERRGVKGVTLILSGVPFTDSGGGQRCSQLAMAFARDGYKVIFVNIYPSFEEKKKLFFNIDYSLFEFVSLDDFVVEDLFQAYAQFPKISILALLEFPHPKFIPIAKALKRRMGKRATIVYDYIDNWRSSLGWEWYSEKSEMDVVSISDHLVASATTLQEDLEARTRKPVHLIPNAVNNDLFDCSMQYEMPVDLPVSKRIVLYAGALWGEWFDWDTLSYCIDHLANAEFVLIGGIDQGKARAFKSGRANVHFLGLKPQSSLPAYFVNASVCIIPFKVDHITRYVNPLKVYEYLAMRKPVVATRMEELKGLPGVTLTATPQEFVRALSLGLSNPSLNNQLVGEFIENNNWRDRLKKMKEIVIRND
jgi:glycosyltransferase involved in cell wall biosynthesis